MVLLRIDLRETPRGDSKLEFSIMTQRNGEVQSRITDKVGAVFLGYGDALQRWLTAEKILCEGLVLCVVEMGVK